MRKLTLKEMQAVVRGTVAPVSGGVCYSNCGPYVPPPPPKPPVCTPRPGVYC